MQKAQPQCLRTAAARMARACRLIVQGCLREEEWLDCDAEFTAVILAGVTELLDGAASDREGKGAAMIRRRG
jgi:hypothetical protein